MATKKPQSAQKTILSALENLTISVGKLAEKVENLEQSTGQSVPVTLEQLEVTTGRLPDFSEEEKTAEPISTASKLDKVRELEEVFNTKKVNPFGTTELFIFEEKLKGMTYADMQNLAYKVGENQNYQPAQLRKALKNAFIQASKSFGGGLRPRPAPANSRLDPKNPKHLKLMQMMGMATQ